MALNSASSAPRKRRASDGDMIGAHEFPHRGASKSEDRVMVGKAAWGNDHAVDQAEYDSDHDSPTLSPPFRGDGSIDGRIEGRQRRGTTVGEGMRGDLGFDFGMEPRYMTV